MTVDIMERWGLRWMIRYLSPTIYQTAPSTHHGSPCDQEDIQDSLGVWWESSGVLSVIVKHWENLHEFWSRTDKITGVSHWENLHEFSGVRCRPDKVTTRS